MPTPESTYPDGASGKRLESAFSCVILAAMSTGVRRGRLAAAAGLFALLLPGSALADEHEAESGPKPQSQRWVPALAIISGPLVNKGEGTIESFNGSPGCRESSPKCGLLFGTNSDQESSVFTFVGLSAEVMTPSFLPMVPGKPRFFVHGDVATSFDTTRTVARTGQASGGIKPPTQFNSDELLPTFSSTQVTGQGHKTTAEVKPLVVTAGAGLAFTIPVGERQIRIKPSFEFMQQEIEVTTFVAKVQSEATGLLANRCSRSGWRPIEDSEGNVVNEVLIRSEIRCRFSEFSGSEKRTMRGIGPGLEVELDTRRVGPLLLTVFASAQAYKWLGSRSFEVESSFSAVDAPIFPASHTFSPQLGIPAPNHVPAPGPNDPYGHDPIAQLPQELSSSGSYELDPWAFRGAVGLRFKWLPE